MLQTVLQCACASDGCCGLPQTGNVTVRVAVYVAVCVAVRVVVCVEVCVALCVCE